MAVWSKSNSLSYNTLSSLICDRTCQCSCGATQRTTALRSLKIQIIISSLQAVSSAAHFFFFFFAVHTIKMASFGELRQRLLHPYYVLHLVYGVVYVIIRINQLIKGQTISFEASISHITSYQNHTLRKAFRRPSPRHF